MPSFANGHTVSGGVFVRDRRDRTHVLGEAITWRLLLRRFRTSQDRWTAAKNLSRHAVRAVVVRALSFNVRIGESIVPAYSLIRETYVQTKIAFSMPLGLFRSPHQVLEHWSAPGKSPEQLFGEKVALFVHFDAGGHVAPAARDFIASLGEAGLDVVFVTNSEHILEEARAFLEQHCAAILIRRNIGYDFGAWRDALDTLGLPRPETRAIFLVNDSLYGPFSDLKPILGAIDFERADLWGATESWQHRYHLQSFFLGCGEAVIRSQAWREFWRSVRPIPCKDWIIRHCEIGFTRAMARGGARCAAIFPSASLLDEREIERLERVIDEDHEWGGQNAKVHAEAIHADHILRCTQRPTNLLNPSVDLWRQLIQAGYPFLKRELLLRNPTRVADVFEWEEVVTKALNVDPQPLAEEIRRSLGERLPAVWSPRMKAQMDQLGQATDTPTQPSRRSTTHVG
ncbi:rhamnan synthesis F family protein [Acidisoma sp.]|uniref:rhamnan synthesis F family protein n=1 Tax=Acidisoma sp. TaxID=1872115 RepID=UPI003AFFD0C0